MRIGTPGFNGNRLQEAREVRGISQTALAMLVGVTPASISQYQSGSTTPSEEVLSKIASKLGFPESFFFLPDLEAREVPTFFRSRASNTKAAQKAAEWKVKRMMGFVRHLSAYLDLPRYVPIGYGAFDPTDITARIVEEAATHLRRTWSLGDGAIADLTLCAENHGIVVSRHRLFEEREQAFSKPLLDGVRDYVVINADIESAVHSRFSLAHELGHMVLHRHLDEEERQEHHKLLEKQANQFAGALLMPEATFRRDIYVADLEVFRRQKQKWLVSTGAMIARCYQLGITDERQNRSLHIKHRRRKWHVEDPLDDVIKPEVPRLFRRSFHVLEESGLQMRDGIITALAYPASDVEEMAALPRGYFDPSASTIAYLDVRPRKAARTDGAPAKVHRLSRR
jgi:Zn-dependent peptidase ImmA (M78 family)/transcriptional regulator with XRE-family HTH domain